jgi:predicted lipid-binding transport protein (Tim44 family)
LDEEAKRLGGSRSFGRQSSGMIQKAQPRQSSSKEGVVSNQQNRSASNESAAVNRNTAAPRRNWGGLLGGLAAGLGLGYLLSQIGFPEGLASFLGNAILIGLLVFLGIWLLRKLRGNAGATQTYREATATVGASATPWRPDPQADAQKPSILYTPSTASSAVTTDFDIEAFLVWAKDAFTRLQVAWDSGDLEGIRPLVTPEMAMEIQKDLQARTGAPSKTEIVSLDAELLSVEGDEAAVRFFGTLREDDNPNVFAEPFSEIWHFLKDNGQWRLAGIQQA